MRLLASSCSSTCPHVSAQLPLDGFSWDLILGTFASICRETLNLVKIGQKYRALTRGPKYVLLLPATYIHHKTFLCNTQYFLCCWKWHVAQQYTQNALLSSHCNDGYANAPQYYVMRTLPVFLFPTLNTLVHFYCWLKLFILQAETTSFVNDACLTASYCKVSDSKYEFSLSVRHSPILA
jgi:hypothetical protein